MGRVHRVHCPRPARAPRPRAQRPGRAPSAQAARLPRPCCTLPAGPARRCLPSARLPPAPCRAPARPPARLPRPPAPASVAAPRARALVVPARAPTHAQCLPHARSPSAHAYAPQLPAPCIAATVTILWLGWALYCNTVQPCLAHCHNTNFVLQPKNQPTQAPQSQYTQCIAIHFMPSLSTAYCNTRHNITI